MTPFKNVKLTKSAAKELRPIPQKFRAAVQAALDALAADPLLGTALLPPFEGCRRYRIGNYRIVYQFDATTLIVLSIRHRKDVYR
ncbi:MAG TPA: type II toxin-antitoxin system RelE/ParE family toxin [Nitrospira sp.]|nr:type II toxin-antitoxin system RelE/ParE family toxin [Nitrospira sp.]MBX7039846.1 type II toxin-antitoxin system RelE/ParE family toxin [Nitrospira sp.]MCW5796118.1 type II toxin-antitoxin system RelE/ParE family toxin [Nitrospira sp.]HMV57462.1 type II toxin-antitoxin system RelE/ParE family toxin [Nitrospira sp.]HMW86887.1 type II toxin-antitoxin system RelE/ParE family toxin [Nitrospira sp.]